MNVKRSILLRVRIAFLMSFLFALAVVVRMGRIQFVEGEKWTTMAEEIGLQFRTVKLLGEASIQITEGCWQRHCLSIESHLTLRIRRQVLMRD